MYAKLHDITDILSGVRTKPDLLSRAGWIPDAEPLDLSTIDINNDDDQDKLNRRAAFDSSRQTINGAIVQVADKQEERIRHWNKCDAALNVTFIQSLSREVYEAIAGLDTAAGQYAEISRRYKEEGLNEACNAWADFNEAGKLTRLKARLIVCGNRQSTDFWRETYAAVAHSTTLKVLLALWQTDVDICHLCAVTADPG